MPIGEARISAYCDWCEDNLDDMDLTPLAGGGWDARNIPRKLERLGWIIIDDKTFCSQECAGKHAKRVISESTRSVITT